MCVNNLPKVVINTQILKILKPDGGQRDDMPPPMAVRLATDLRPSADGSAVRTSLGAGQLQAASVPIA